MKGELRRCGGRGVVVHQFGLLDHDWSSTAAKCANVCGVGRGGGVSKRRGRSVMREKEGGQTFAPADAQAAIKRPVVR
eukprot:201255-Chlamydomonas_euryale.AAC.1